MYRQLHDEGLLAEHCRSLYSEVMFWGLLRYFRAALMLYEMVVMELCALCSCVSLCERDFRAASRNIKMQHKLKFIWLI